MHLSIGLEPFVGGVRGGKCPPVTWGYHHDEVPTVVRMSGGEVLTTVGPFAETKEHLVGFYVIEADTAGRPSSSSRRPHLEGLSECAHRSASESSQRIHVGRLSKR